MFKKLSFFLLTTLSSLSPLALLIACSQTNYNNSENQDDNKAKRDLAATTTLDLANLTSVTEMFNQFNNITNVFMPASANELVKTQNTAKNQPWITAESYDKLKEYTNNINFKFQKINFKFNANSHLADLTPIIQTINIVKRKVNLGYSSFLNSADASKFIPNPLKVLVGDVPIVSNMPFALAYMIGALSAKSLEGFASIPEDGYLDYEKMMDNYHDFTYGLWNSTAFKNWTLQLETKKCYDLRNGSLSKLIQVAPGDLFDKTKKPDVKTFGFKVMNPKSSIELNNLEAQLFSLFFQETITRIITILKLN